MIEKSLRFGGYGLRTEDVAQKLESPLQNLESWEVCYYGAAREHDSETAEQRGSVTAGQQGSVTTGQRGSRTARQCDCRTVEPITFIFVRSPKWCSHLKLNMATSYVPERCNFCRKCIEEWLDFLYIAIFPKLASCSWKIADRELIQTSTTKFWCRA